MTYDVPELRLVGATRQIVLGEGLRKVEPIPYTTDEFNDQYDLEQPETAW
jgi:hypothetical protein